MLPALPVPAPPSSTLAMSGSWPRPLTLPALPVHHLPQGCNSPAPPPTNSKPFSTSGPPFSPRPPFLTSGLLHAWTPSWLGATVSRHVPPPTQVLGPSQPGMFHLRSTPDPLNRQGTQARAFYLAALASPSTQSWLDKMAAARERPGAARRGAVWEL